MMRRCAAKRRPIGSTAPWRNSTARSPGRSRWRGRRIPSACSTIGYQARAQETPVRPRDGELSVSDGERQYVVLPLTLRVPAFAVAGQQARHAGA